MIRRRASTTVAALATIAIAITACGSDDPASEPPTIAATTGILADVTERVAGDDAEVVQIIPDASSPHDFQLSAQDRQTIEESLLLVHNGAGLEPGIPVAEIDASAFAVSEHVGELLPFDAGDERVEAEGADEGRGAADPHVWMDPTRTATALPTLAEALAEADPEHAEGYRPRAEAFSAELRALDRKISETLSEVPAAERELVTSHDSLGYFADRYGFRVVATPFPASGIEAEASASTVREVQEAIEAAGVPTVFAQVDDDPELLSLIADQAGVAIDDGLLVEAPADAGSYVEMLRRDAELIRDGLVD